MSESGRRSRELLWPRRFVCEYLVGPVDGRRHRCLRCLEEIGPGQEWERMWAPDGSYAIGIHVACLVEAEAG